jgi:hypothetical protein
MTQMIGVMGKDTIAQNTEQTQERLNYLLNDYKNELLNFKLKMGNLEPVNTDNRFGTQLISNHNEQDIKTKPKNKTSKSPGKKTINSKKSVKKSDSRSISPVKHFEQEYSCMQCALNECNKHGRKTEFLEELLDNSSPDRKFHDISFSPNKRFFEEME